MTACTGFRLSLPVATLMCSAMLQPRGYTREHDVSRGRGSEGSDCRHEEDIKSCGECLILLKSGVLLLIDQQAEGVQSKALNMAGCRAIPLGRGSWLDICSPAGIISTIWSFF